MAIRILLADDHEMLRKGLRSLIEQDNNFDVVGEAGNGLDAVRLAGKHKPDIVLMDLAMPDLNGIDATRQILQGQPKTKIIALSMHTDSRMVDRILRAGALGYILKESAFEELKEAIRVILRGGTYLSPMIARDLVENLRKGGAAAGRPSLLQTLTDREREVLQMMSEGLSTKEIAGKLFVSPKTVETHRAKLMDKLQINTTAELTKFAIREGLTTLE